MTPNDVNERILEIHRILDETSELIHKHDMEQRPTRNNQKPVTQVEFRIFEGSWMGTFYPSLLQFPFGTVVLKKGAHGESLDELLDEMKMQVERQLDGFKRGLVDTIR